MIIPNISSGRRDQGASCVLREMAMLRTLLSLLLLTIAVHICLAQPAKTINCPADRVHVDTRTVGSGGAEICELILPGSLEVRDGPYRFWFNPDFEGAVGNYKEGREIGHWKECDRFGNCQQKDYSALDPEEQERPGIKDEIPITYSGGKYIFDFASCRGTTFTYAISGKPELELGISGRLKGCIFSYATKDEIEHGSETRNLGRILHNPLPDG